MVIERIARVSVGKTNRNPYDVIDGARRQVDHLGSIGIIAKRGQTDDVYREKGHLDFVFPDRETRERYIERVEEHGDPAVIIQRIKRIRQKSIMHRLRSRSRN